LAALKKGLTDLGYIEGKTLKIEYRYAKLDHEYDAVMAELVSRKVTIIFAGNAPAAVAAGKAPRTIPVVLGAVNAPAGLGAVDSLETNQRPFLHTGNGGLYSRTPNAALQRSATANNHFSSHAIWLLMS
jgi:hypothetical protein